MPVREVERIQVVDEQGQEHTLVRFEQVQASTHAINWYLTTTNFLARMVDENTFEIGFPWGRTLARRKSALPPSDATPGT